MRGGYRIIDFHGVNLSSGTAVVIKGAYESTGNSHNKATMVSGLVVAGVAYPDFYVAFDNHSAKTNINAKAITISVAENDNVTVTVTE